MFLKKIKNLYFKILLLTKVLKLIHILKNLHSTKILILIENLHFKTLTFNKNSIFYLKQLRNYILKLINLTEFLKMKKNNLGSKIFQIVRKTHIFHLF